MQVSLDKECISLLKSYHLLCCNNKEGVDNYIGSITGSNILISCSKCGAPLALAKYTGSNITNDDTIINKENLINR